VSGEQAVETLSDRVESRTTHVEALVHEVRAALEALPAGPDGTVVEALERQDRRLSALTAEVDRVAAAAAASQASTMEDARALRALVDELDPRIAASELALATLASRDAARLDDVAGRLEEIERREAERAESLEPFAGAGRLQVEIRALELKLEHAEAAARETRDAVLEQVEALASRIESRLRRVESEPEPQQPAAHPRGVTGGDVVSIRSGEV
jgi:hypothetical protein